MSDCALPKGRWSGVEWRQPEHLEINDPKPALPIRVEFDRGRAWEHPLALNGRKVEGVFVDGVEHFPRRDACDMSLVYEGYPCSDWKCSTCGKIHSAPRLHNYCPRCGAPIESADGRPV